MLVLVLLTFVMVNTLSYGDQTCPDVKVIGVGDSDKLTILRGCPGHPGFPGQKGEVGAQGEKGQKGFVGESGKAGPPGIKGQKGSDGQTGIPGLPGVKGEKGESGTRYSSVSRNCKELQIQGEVLSGWYAIYPDGSQPMKVFCDMDTDEGGWIVFQRRLDGSVDFFRDWATYKKGFGSRINEFWLGNDNLHKITSTGTWELRIDLQDFENQKYFAKYSSFKILGESEKYQLLLGGFKEGTAGDSLSGHNNMKFTTKDQDNDVYENNCAALYKGGWWYGACHNSNLNGLYHLGKHDSYADGINWSTVKGYNYSFKHVEMKIRGGTGK